MQNLTLESLTSLALKPVISRSHNDLLTPYSAPDSSTSCCTFTSSSIYLYLCWPNFGSQIQRLYFIKIIVLKIKLVCMPVRP